MASSGFELVNARHAVRAADDTHVEFINAHELSYRRVAHALILQAERHIAEDGAPDGRDVLLPRDPSWPDGRALTPDEVQALVADLRAAAVPLKTKFWLQGA
jgi:hypothetical protein